jgi:hypothetical protein
MGAVLRHDGNSRQRDPAQAQQINAAVAAKRKAKTVAALLQDANAKECDDELERLMKERSIKAGDYKTLARQLAVEHKSIRPAPLKLARGTWGGVTQKKKKGRRTDWTLKDLDALAAAVAIAKKNLGFSTDDGALRHLIVKGGRWAPPANSSPSQRLKNPEKHAVTSEQNSTRR